MKLISPEVITSIKNFIAEKWTDEQATKFPNRLLREDVLDLLDEFCTVIYYPLETEENNGFHVTGIPDSQGNEMHFVFINTAQTIEKQVFTAAHELGHVWKVDEYVCSHCNLSLTEELREQIINRFAAELLIPEEEFKMSFHLETQKLKAGDGKITAANMLKAIVALMNQFFAPLKAIVYRCYELNAFSEKTAALLLGEGDIPQEIIEDKIKEIVRDNGYIKIHKASNKKWIAGLAELLDRAETEKAVSAGKIEKMRKEFSLTQTSNDVKMNEIVEIKTVEGC